MKIADVRGGGLGGLGVGNVFSPVKLKDIKEGWSSPEGGCLSRYDRAVLLHGLRNCEWVKGELGEKHIIGYMKVHEHSSTSVINREALELHTREISNCN